MFLSGEAQEASYLALGSALVRCVGFWKLIEESCRSHDILASPR